MSYALVGALIFGICTGIVLHANFGKGYFYQEAIHHHAGKYVSPGTSPDVIFIWNDEK